MKNMINDLFTGRSLRTIIHNQIVDRQSRVEWADVAKGIGIILLVVWHTIGHELIFNRIFVFLRMPLLFFVSGMFASNAQLLPIGSFLKTKVGNLLYLYVLWSIVLFILNYLVMAIFIGESPDFMRIFAILWQPPGTLWFLYALAIAFVLSKILIATPYILVLAISLVLYFWSTSDGIWWPATSFLNRVLRLFPFFWIGLVSKHLLQNWVQKCAASISLAIFGSYLLLSYLIVTRPALMEVGGLTFSLSAIGIIGIAGVSQMLSGSRISYLMLYVGRSTLYIYLMHRIFLYYFNVFWVRIGTIDLAVKAVFTILNLILCVVIGNYLAGTRMNVFFEAPWIRSRKKCPPISKTFVASTGS